MNSIKLKYILVLLATAWTLATCVRTQHTEGILALSNNDSLTIIDAERAIYSFSMADANCKDAKDMRIGDKVMVDYQGTLPDSAKAYRVRVTEHWLSGIITGVDLKHIVITVGPESFGFDLENADLKRMHNAQIGKNAVIYYPADLPEKLTYIPATQVIVD